MWDDLLYGWLSGHPHVCPIIFCLIVPVLAHHYYPTWSIRKVIGMRRGDWLRLQPPRTRVHSGRAKTKPPVDPSTEPTPKY